MRYIVETFSHSAPRSSVLLRTDDIEHASTFAESYHSKNNTIKTQVYDDQRKSIAEDKNQRKWIWQNIH